MDRAAQEQAPQGTSEQRQQAGPGAATVQHEAPGSLTPGGQPLVERAAYREDQVGTDRLRGADRPQRLIGHEEPARWRLGFFAAFSMAAVFFVLGWPNGAWVLGLGCGLIACCCLPLPLWLRVTLLVFAGVMLAVLRMESTAPFWLVLAAMFMIRLIIYVFETRRDKTRPPLTGALAYFFQLPNICFFFYPAVSFKTFIKAPFIGDDMVSPLATDLSAAEILQLGWVKRRTPSRSSSSTLSSSPSPRTSGTASARGISPPATGSGPSNRTRNRWRWTRRTTTRSRSLRRSGAAEAAWPRGMSEAA